MNSLQFFVARRKLGKAGWRSADLILVLRAHTFFCVSSLWGLLLNEVSRGSSSYRRRDYVTYPECDSKLFQQYIIKDQQIGAFLLPITILSQYFTELSMLISTLLLAQGHMVKLKGKVLLLLYMLIPWLNYH